MTRLTDNDKRFGPLTWGKSSWNALRLVFSTGGNDEGHEPNHLTAYAFGYVFRLNLPTKLKPHRIKHVAKFWSQEDIDRMGRDWYYEVFAREYGFSLHEGFLQIFHGPQTHDSVTTKSKAWHLPWTQWRHIRTSVFDDKGAHFHTDWSRPRGYPFRDDWSIRYEAKKACPSIDFEFDDYDGERIRVTTRIEERLWLFGEGWFKWLSLFRRPMLRRCLDLEFSKEVGPEKGSWKGGTTGHSIEMLPGEMHEAAFRRYCEKEQRSKYRNFEIKFVGAATKEPNVTEAIKEREACAQLCDQLAAEVDKYPSDCSAAIRARGQESA